MLITVMITIKTEEEIGLLRENNLLVSATLAEVAKHDADEDVDEDTDSEDSMDSDDTEESENPFIQYFENQGFFR